MKTNWFITLLIAGSILFSAAAAFAAMPKAGDTAPLFEGQDQDGKGKSHCQKESCTRRSWICSVQRAM